MISNPGTDNYKYRETNIEQGEKKNIKRLWNSHLVSTNQNTILELSTTIPLLLHKYYLRQELYNH